MCGADPLQEHGHAVYELLWSKLSEWSTHTLTNATCMCPTYVHKEPHIQGWACVTADGTATCKPVRPCRTHNPAVHTHGAHTHTIPQYTHMMCTHTHTQSYSAQALHHASISQCTQAPESLGMHPQHGASSMSHSPSPSPFGLAIPCPTYCSLPPIPCHPCAI